MPASADYGPLTAGYPERIMRRGWVMKPLKSDVFLSPSSKESNP